MTIQFTCSTCKKNLQAANDKVGARVRCPGCKNIVQVPSPEAQAPSPAKAVKQSEEWSYTKDGKSKIGPFSLAQFQMLASSGAIQLSDMVQKEGTVKWIPASQVTGLFSSSAIQAKPQHSAPAYPIAQLVLPSSGGKQAGKGIGWRLVAIGLGAVACVTIAIVFSFWNQLTGTPNKDDRLATYAGVSDQTPTKDNAKVTNPKNDQDISRTNGKDAPSTTESPENQPSEKIPAGDRPDPPKKETVTKKGSDAKLPEKGSLKDASPSGTSVVFAEGVGTTQDEALKDAFRNSVQRVVGVFVDSETLVKSDAIISDKVLTFSDGAIKKYEELDHTDSKGLFRVKIKAAVERRNVAARLEAAHISIKSVDVTNVADSFAKELHADLEKLANEITEKEAKENAKKMLESDLSRIAKINMIEAKVVGELERGTKVGNKLPLKITVRYEVNKAAFDEAMSKLEKSLLMNSSSWGKITFLATPDLIMKRDNQSSINEEIGKDNVFVLVNKGLSSEKWRSHWHYYVLPVDVGKMLSQRLVEKKPPNVKLSFLDKEGQVVAVDEFTADNIVRAFRYHDPKVPNDKLSNLPAAGTVERYGYLQKLAQQYDIDISSLVGRKTGVSPFSDLQSVTTFLRSPQQPNYSTQPFNRKCYFAVPFVFNVAPDIRYMMSADTVRESPFTLDEIMLIQSVKCELFP